MRNSEVADLLDRLGEMVEATGEDRFKVVAYHRAATSIRNMEEDVEDLWRKKKLEEIQYVGGGIAKKINEYLETGKLRLLDDLAAKTPPGVPLLMKVQGIGPRTAYRLAHELGVGSVEELKKALEAGRLDEEFGSSVRKSFLVGIEQLQSFEKRMLIPEAEGVFQKLVSYFGALGIEVGMAGALGEVGAQSVTSTCSRQTRGPWMRSLAARAWPRCSKADSNGPASS